MAVWRSSTNCLGATTTLRGGHLRAPSTHAVNIDEDDALHGVAHELATGVERLRGEALEHALEPTMRSTDICDTQRATEHAHPPTKRAPPAHRLLANPTKRAHLVPHGGGARALPPAAERPRDGWQPVAQARRHATRHHRHYRPATTTEVATYGDLRDLRRLAETRRSQLKTPPKPMADDAETLTDRPPSCTAARTPLRTDSVHRRNPLLPKLDVDRRNDDP